MKILAFLSTLLPFAVQVSAEGIFSSFHSELGEKMSRNLQMDGPPPPCFPLFDAGEPPMPDSNNTEVCVTKGNTLKCDYSLVDHSAYAANCTSFGGEMVAISISMCPFEPPGFSFKKLIASGIEMCVVKQCDEPKKAQSYHDKFLALTGGHCPKDSKKKKFSFGDKSKSCDWLQKKPKKKQAAICFKKKFQTYKDGSLPASQVCLKTCKPSDDKCVEENKAAKFVFPDMSMLKPENVPGLPPLVTNTCGWLAKEDPNTIYGICESHFMIKNPMSDFNSKYGTAVEVCTDTCDSCGVIYLPGMD